MLIDRRDKVINICEMKFAANEYEIDKDYEKKLINKIECFRKETGSKKALHLTNYTKLYIACYMPFIVKQRYI